MVYREDTTSYSLPPYWFRVFRSASSFPPCSFDFQLHVHSRISYSIEELGVFPTLVPFKNLLNQ